MQLFSLERVKKDGRIDSLERIYGLFEWIMLYFVIEIKWEDGDGWRQHHQKIWLTMRRRADDDA